MTDSLDERLAKLSTYVGLVRDCTHGEISRTKYDDFVRAIEEARELLKARRLG